MRRPYHLVLLAAACLVPVGLAGCGDPDAGRSPAEESAPAALGGDPTPSASPTVDVAVRARFETPLEELQRRVALSGVHDPQSPEGLAWTAQVTACMTAQGYEWDRTPVPGAVDLREDPLAGEHAEEHAYGRVEQARTIARLTASPPPDPHAGWTPEQRDAYELALHGGYPPGHDLDPDAWVDGCTGIANRDVYGIERDGVTMQTDESWKEWVAFESDLYAVHRAAEEPVVPEALAAWKECMAAAGFPETGDLADVVEISPLLDARIEEARVAAAAAGRGEAFADSPELAAVGQYEDALAQADLLGCREDYDRTLYEARLAAEEAFVAGRPTEVEGWTAYQLAQAAQPS